VIQGQVCLTTKLRLLTDQNSLCLWEGKAQILEDQLKKCAGPVSLSTGSMGNVLEPRGIPAYCPPLLLNVQNLLDK